MSGATNAIAGEDNAAHPIYDGWMQTMSGKAYHFAAPKQNEVVLADIAHALGNLCRFGGHCREFYSVAEHSVLVSQVVPQQFAMQGLMHDATEAYVVDVPRPLKVLLGEPYARMEALAWAAICEKFHLPLELDRSVKQADNTVLLAERDVLLDKPPIEWAWARGLRPAKVYIKRFDPAGAATLFLARFREIQENT